MKHGRGLDNAVALLPQRATGARIVRAPADGFVLTKMPDLPWFGSLGLCGNHSSVCFFPHVRSAAARAGACPRLRIQVPESTIRNSQDTFLFVGLLEAGLA
jgi:hypothetical protein